MGDTLTYFHRTMMVWRKWRGGDMKAVFFPSRFLPQKMTWCIFEKEFCPTPQKKELCFFALGNFGESWPGDSLWPFHPLVGGHLTILNHSKGSLNHPEKVTKNCQGDIVARKQIHTAENPTLTSLVSFPAWGTLPNAGDIVKFDLEPSPTKPGQPLFCNIANLDGDFLGYGREQYGECNAFTFFLMWFF